MDRTLIQEQGVRQVMEAQFASIKPRDGFRVELVIDDSKKRFLLMSDGWYGYRRSYGPMLDIALKDGKVWVFEDNTEDGITDELLAKGLRHDEIVIAWQPEYKRELTGFAVA